MRLQHHLAGVHTIGEQRQHTIGLPSLWRSITAWLTENGLLLGRIKVSVLHGGAQSTGLNQGISDQIGLLARTTQNQFTHTRPLRTELAH